MEHDIPPLALQLFTVRDRMERDLPGTLEEVASFGYDGVEFAGLFGHRPEAVRTQLDRLGLRVCGSHFDLTRMSESFDECVAEARTLGHEILVVPYLAEEFRGPAGYASATELMVRLADRLHDEGLRLAYHNHAFEFDPIEPGRAQRGIDVIVDSPPDKVLLEIDVYWALHGDVDPIAFLHKHIHRAPLLHLKDMLDLETKRFTEIDRGVIPFHDCVRLAVKQGEVEWFIIEQDSDFAIDSMQSAKDSLKAMRRICHEVEHL